MGVRWWKQKQAICMETHKRHPGVWGLKRHTCWGIPVEPWPAEFFLRKWNVGGKCFARVTIVRRWWRWDVCKKNILYYWLLCKRYFDIHNIYDCLSTTLESIYLENRCQNPRPINNTQGCVKLYFYFLVGLRIFGQLNEFAELLILEKCPNLFTITIHPAYWFIGMSALWEESRVPKNRMEKWT